MRNDKITFWKFLQENRIEIPIIQRDYAQGRKGKAALRRKFLRNIKSSLEMKTELKLDFIYGVMSYGSINPLDGQQRLTTLWLLHWFIAYKAKRLFDPTAIEILKRFTYETRVSSREFYECLAEFTDEQPPEKSLSECLQNQTWFRASWKQDPTVQAMLRMLSGESNYEDDSLEEVFGSLQNEVLETYWDLLSGDDCPIVFYYLDLAGLRHTDDLYIKMNARGVPLTSFENLKADLVRYIRAQAESEDISADERDRWRLLLGDDKSNIIAKIDTAWTDVFWTIRSEDDQIDEIYYAFLNRFLLNSWIVGEMKKQDVKPGDDLKFDYFYGRDPALRKDEGDDHRIAYAAFDVYKEALSINVVESLFKTLDNIVDFVRNKGEVPPPSWKEDEPSVLLPSYYKNEADKFIRDFAGREIRKVKPITQPQRVVFFALCKFFENGWEQDNDINNLKDWLRVVWNIVENANINSISSMIGCMRLIASIASHSHNILNYLAEAHENDIKSDFAKEQVREEALKARKIQSDGEWEGPILEAEKMPCLKGRIGVLFQNREATELNLFKQRLALLESILKLSQDNPYYLQKVLLSRWDSAGLSKTIDLSENDRDKKKLLTDTLSDCFRKVENNSIVINKNEWVNDLCQTDLLVHSRGKIVSFKTGVVVLWATSGQRWVFWGNYIKGNVILGRRRKLLTATDDIQLANENMRVGRTSFVSGRNIEFSFGGHWFQWKGTPNHEEADVYLLKDNWKDESNNIYKKHPDDPEKSGNGKQYYCFRVGMEEDVQSFKDKLSALISASQSG